MLKVLATDLDGTFLEGDTTMRGNVYRTFSALKQQFPLIYTTGRGVAAVQQLMVAYDLPEPLAILADHGTHIVEGKSFNEITALQEPIQWLWQCEGAENSHQKLAKLLSQEPGISPQPLSPLYRAPYYYDRDLLKSSTLTKIKEAGFDPLISCGLYLDILPRGVNKGSSLLRLLDYLNIVPDQVLTAGDSLNDLPLFTTGLKSIAVGNAEPDLKVQCQELRNVYQSQHPGLHGILEGLEYWECKFPVSNWKFT